MSVTTVKIVFKLKLVMMAKMEVETDFAVLLDCRLFNVGPTVDVLAALILNVPMENIVTVLLLVKLLMSTNIIVEGYVTLLAQV